MTARAAALLRHLRRLASPTLSASEDDADAALLDRFVRDKDEDAFAALVRRHGALVRGVCRRMLGNAHTADDAFQAVFLVLARRAAVVRPGQRLAAWLHGVSYRVALKARAGEAKRQAREVPRIDLDPPDPRPDPLAELTAREFLAAVDEEVLRLPEVYRLPVVLCCLEGRTREEAARRLGWSEGAVKGRLERGRARLHARLARRGLTLAAALAAVEASRCVAVAAAPVSLAAAAIQVAAGQATAPALVSAEAVALAKGVVHAMMRTRFMIFATVVLALGLAGGATGVLALAAPPPADPAPPARSADPLPVAPAKPAADPDVYALLLVGGPAPQLLPEPGRAAPADADSPVDRNTQVFLLRSRPVLAAALREKGVAGLRILKGKADPIGWLERNLGAVFLDDSRLLRVSVAGGDAAEQAALANAVATAYLDMVFNEERTQKQERLRDLEKLLSRQEDTLNKQREELRREEERNGSSGSLKQQFVREDLNRLREEFHRVHLEKIAAQARLDYRNTRGGAEGEGVPKLEGEVAVLVGQEKLLKQEIDPLTEEAQTGADAEAAHAAQLSELRDKITATKQMAQKLAAEVEAMRVEQYNSVSVRMVQEAEAPGPKD